MRLAGQTACVATHQLGAAPMQHGPRRILLVDDSRAQRVMLRHRLGVAGYDVIEAASGQEALDILACEKISLVLSDWMMPGISGPDLCRKIREGSARDGDAYTYFILLTSKHEKDDVSAGLEAGADDFLSKPVDPGELSARLKAGRRLVELHERMAAQKLAVSEAYSELKLLYTTVERDLRAAAALQRETIPPAFGTCNGFALALHYQSAGHVGGDHLGYFPVGETGIGIYSIDVSGHGVSSALLALRLAQAFSPNELSDSVAFDQEADGSLRARAPEAVLAELNARFQTSEMHDLYFTIAYCVIDGRTRRGRLCVGGHPPPVLIGPRGGLRFQERGGPPAGLLREADFPAQDFDLARGGRLLLYTDGVTEAELPGGGMLDNEGLAEILRETPQLPLDELPEHILSRVATRTGSEQFQDDISVLAVELPETDAAHRPLHGASGSREIAPSAA